MTKMEKIETPMKNLNNLLKCIDSGALKLPDFQRKYSWGPQKVKKLLDSIQKNHPSGSLLLLRSRIDDEIISERAFENVERAEKRTEFLVLDGQQRLTS